MPDPWLGSFRRAKKSADQAARDPSNRCCALDNCIHKDRLSPPLNKGKDHGRNKAADELGYKRYTGCRLSGNEKGTVVGGRRGRGTRRKCDSENGGNVWTGPLILRDGCTFCGEGTRGVIGAGVVLVFDGGFEGFLWGTVLCDMQCQC